VSSENSVRFDSAPFTHRCWSIAVIGPAEQAGRNPLRLSGTSVDVVVRRRYAVYTMTAQARIRRWGNSLAVRIPRAVAEESGVQEGVLVDLVPASGKLLVRPARPRQYRLADLLARVRPSNLHEVTETGRRVGREVW
jgi:antitoxin MazE